MFFRFCAFGVTKKSESSFIFDLIDEIDPNAFVAQSAVIGVYGQGIDRVKVRKKINLQVLKLRISYNLTTAFL